MKKIIHKVKNFLSNDTFKYILFIILIIFLIISVAFKIISINANAANEPSDGGGSVIVSDLTGTTWVLNKSVTLEIGMFEYWVDFESNGNFYDVITLLNWVDYSDNPPLGENYIKYTNTNNFDYINVYEGAIGSTLLRFQADNEYLTITISGGDDVQDTWLISWLLSNGSLVNNNVPEPEPIIGWSNDESINFFRTPIVQTTPPTVDDYQTIYYYSGWDKPYAILRDNISIDGESFFPIVQYYDTYYEALYYGMDYIEREILTESVFMDGYEKGKKAGYQNGLSMGESSALGQNLLGDILSAPIRALDNLVIIDTPSGFSISVWNIFSALIGVSLFIWFLKMFAGG